MYCISECPLQGLYMYMHACLLAVGNIASYPPVFQHWKRKTGWGLGYVYEAIGDIYYSHIVWLYIAGTIDNFCPNNGLFYADCAH